MVETTGTPSGANVLVGVAFGAMIGVVGGVVPMMVMGYLSNVSPWRIGLAAACGLDILAFVAILLIAIRTRWRGLVQGVLLGGWIAFVFWVVMAWMT